LSAQLPFSDQKKNAKPEGSSGSQRGAPPAPDAGLPNPFDFSQFSNLLNVSSFFFRAAKSMICALFLCITYV
jgi:hypothetical protein